MRTSVLSWFSWRKLRAIQDFMSLIHSNSELMLQGSNGFKGGATGNIYYILYYIYILYFLSIEPNGNMYSENKIGPKMEPWGTP